MGRHFELALYISFPKWRPFIHTQQNSRPRRLRRGLRLHDRLERPLALEAAALQPRALGPERDREQGRQGGQAGTDEPMNSERSDRLYDSIIYQSDIKLWRYLFVGMNQEKIEARRAYQRHYYQNNIERKREQARTSYARYYHSGNGQQVKQAYDQQNKELIAWKASYRYYARKGAIDRFAARYPERLQHLRAVGYISTEET
eukprot:SAG22_NODE_616_length_8539_cov_5.330213_1_plen_202_part_00